MTDTAIQKAASGLTDGTGVSPLTWVKFVKDLSADLLLGLPAALVAAGISGLPTDKSALMIALVTVGTGAVKAVYRAWLRWATS